MPRRYFIINSYPDCYRVVECENREDLEKYGRKYGNENSLKDRITQIIVDYVIKNNDFKDIAITIGTLYDSSKKEYLENIIKKTLKDISRGKGIEKEKLLSVYRPNSSWKL